MFKNLTKRQKIVFSTVGVVVIAILYTFFYYIPSKFVVDKEGLDYTDSIPAKIVAPIKMIYGVPQDSFNIETGRVRNGESLDKYLQSFNLTNERFTEAINKANAVFDLRKVRTGNKWAKLLSKKGDSIEAHLVYEINYIDFLHLSLGDTIIAKIGKKEVKSLPKISSGTINSSLWNAMKESHTNPLLAIELSDIFAWSVDFFGIGKGDSYKVYYDEDYVDGVSIGISNIHAAIFKHKGRDFYAFKFAENGVDNSYYDEVGNSLKKAFLKAPLKFSRISSKFSRSRFHPVLKYFRPHLGIDYAAPTGTPVYTIGDGTVIARGYDGKGGGNYVKVRHNSVYTSVYMHLNKIESGINTGSSVRQGEVIGTVGKTGLATGPHLDFRVYMNNSPIDPLKIESPSVEPIKEQNMSRYKEFIAPLQKTLATDSIK